VSFVCLRALVMALNVRFSAILSGLSYALDLTEGHPRGHASRSCLIGMRVGRVLGLSADDRSHLFCALLLKDAGCSSNSARVFQLHPYYTYQILERVPVFGELAFDASAHHERLDGRGYFRNLRDAQLSPSSRILCVADQLDALSADRRTAARCPPNASSRSCGASAAPVSGPTRLTRPNES